VAKVVATEPRAAQLWLLDPPPQQQWPIDFTKLTRTSLDNSLQTSVKI
jgi:hypothetical protein